MHLKEVPELGIWALYIMSWILDKYPSEASLIIPCAACTKVRVLIQTFKLDTKNMDCDCPSSKGVCWQYGFKYVDSIGGTALLPLSNSMHIMKLKQGN